MRWLGRPHPPPPSPRTAIAVAVLLLTVLLLEGRGRAHPLEGDAEEQRLLSWLRKEKFIRAREQAEKLLARRPTSIIARYALAQAFFEEEANLPRALHHLQLVERRLLQRHGSPPRHALAQRWHRRVLLDQVKVLGEMDRRTEQLEVIGRHDALYQPKQDHRRIWPLMKLHRFAEATRIANKLIRSSDAAKRVSGYNGLLSIEFERERPQACFKVAMRALSATGYRSCVLNLNAAEAAFAVFRFDEVERLAQRSVQAPQKDCPSSAHPHLASLYLLRGDFQRAVSAVKAARTAGVERRHRQQFEMTLNAWLMRLLSALGKSDKALELARRVVRAPDRMGLTSFSQELMELIHTVDYRAALEAEIERLRERASARTVWARLKIWLQIKRHRLSSWRARRKAATPLAKGSRLRGLLRPYLKPLPPWRTPELIEIAGHGVFAEAVERARRRERMKAQVEPYFAAGLGEIAYREGRRTRALELARQALAGLPKDEVLLRGRVLAWAADAALALGKAKLARDHFDAVLYRWPTALRLLGIRVPVDKISAEGDQGSTLAAKIAGRLRRSRRLKPTGGLGFKVHVEQRGTAVRSCLSGPRGRRYACGVIDLSKVEGKEDEKITAAVDAFHDQVFAPKIDLTQQDINSLDGSAVRGRADEVLREVLGQ